MVLKLKRAESPPLRWLKTVARKLLNPAAPALPRFLLPPFRLLYELHYFSIVLGRFVITALYRQPAFQSRCASVGHGLRLDGLPFVTGPVEIHLGENVYFGGKVSITSGRVLDNPRLTIKDRAEIGWNSIVVVNKEVIIEEDVRVSYNCNISDSDGHCREADLRAAGVPPKVADIRPVRICRNAWIGNGSYVMKGVTIGEGAIIGANSVVITNIPAFSLAMGNPAEVLIRNFGKPSTAAKPEGPPTEATGKGQ
jgi:acetyltransferase-like isoleucine patch superfamily enzyme